MQVESVVLDPAVVVSGLLRPDGPSGLLLRACLRGELLAAVLTPAILEEIENTLRQRTIRRHLDGDPGELIAALAGVAVLVDPTGVPLPGSASSGSTIDDEYFLAAAVSGARFLATTDPRLLRSPHAGVEVVAPGSLVDWLAIASDARETLSPLER